MAGPISSCFQKPCPEAFPKPKNTLVTWSHLAFQWTISTSTAPGALPAAQGVDCFGLSALF